LAIEGGYTGIAALSNFSAVLYLSAASAFLHDYKNWEGSDFDLTRAERDRIDELVSKAEAEVIMSSVGLIMPLATAFVPEFMLLCDGANHLRVDYPDLYAILDPVFIVDLDNFVTPNLQDKFVLGSLTEPVGTTGGSNTHTLTTPQLPSHSHLYQKTTIGVSPEGGGVPIPAALPVEVPTPTSNTGAGDAVNHQNPFISLLYGIVSGS